MLPYGKIKNKQKQKQNNKKVKHKTKQKNIQRFVILLWQSQSNLGFLQYPWANVYGRLHTAIALKEEFS